MRRVLSRPAVLLSVTLLMVCTLSPAGDAALLVFHDGFSLEGRVKRGTTYITDPNGASFTIPAPGAFYTIEDGARSIIFSPQQVHDVIKEDAQKKAELVKYAYGTVGSAGNALPGKWEIEEFPPFNSKWERILHMTVAGNKVDVRQRLTFLSPEYLRVDAVRFDWIAYYKTRELDPQTIRTLIQNHHILTKKADPKKNEKESDRRLQIYRFLLQAGWHDEAEKEIESIIEAFPSLKDQFTPLADGLKRLRAFHFVEDLDRAFKLGQYERVREGLALFDKQNLGARVDQKQLLQVQTLKSKLDTANEKLTDAQRLMKLLLDRVAGPARKSLVEATTAIKNELNVDTVARLETFLGQALGFERALKEGKADRPADEVLAFAVSGWLLGDMAAGRDVELAQRLWEMRKLILEHQKNDDPVARKRLAANSPGRGVGVDEVARMVQLLPPVEAHTKLSTDPIEIKLPEDVGKGFYYVQLPPEYHHMRSYPALFVLHHSGEKAKDALKRWQALAAQHGYILVAPQWSQAVKPSYKYSEREHAILLGCLRDVRRRFQVDSDRVFLFGCEQGGQMALDVGLAHPDQFAGVLPMSATPRYFCFRYWPNAQYLPLYVVNGDRTGDSAKEYREKLFKKWAPKHYPALYVEYRGRIAEWFEAEPPLMFNWMNRKKRANPQRELGIREEEFKTMRALDNRFYWLSTDSLQPRVLNDVAAWNKNAMPATLQARIFSTKDGPEIQVKTSGVNQVTIWLGPGMIEYDKMVKVVINSGQLRPNRKITPNVETLLEHLYQLGDRQRLYWARIDVKV